MLMSNRRDFLTHSATAAVASAVFGELSPFIERGMPPFPARTQSDASARPPTFKEYLEKAAIPHNLIDEFVKGEARVQFDPEVGYILGNGIPHDGVNNSSTLETVQGNGARTSFLYSDRKPRINTYGNSFTQCQQVSDGETWQEYLAAHLGEPIRNFGVGGFGVYQAYRRLIREEKTDHGAEYLIFYVWGDDPIRSLFRSRWAEIYIGHWSLVGPQPFDGEGGFWSHIEIDLDTGHFVEKEQLLPTKESLYHMTDPKWMVDHLESDVALQLAVFRIGGIADLDRATVTRLASRLGFDFDWSLSNGEERSPNSAKDKQSLTPMQMQAQALLDRYSLRATRYILDNVKMFAAEHKKRLMVVLFDPRAMVQMKVHGTRYDQETVDYLKQEGFNYFDMNEVHLADFKQFNLSWEDYLKRYFIGHYNPTGNHFFAFSIKDRIVQWLDPKPITYQQGDQQSVNFRGYIRGYQ